MRSRTKRAVEARTLVFAAGICAAVLLATGQALAQTPFPPLVDPIPAGIPSSGIAVNLTPILSSDLVSPVGGAVAPGDPDHLYIADQPGKIYAIDVAGRHTGAHRLFLDLSARLIPLGVNFGTVKLYDERGLLGLAFHPDFERNGLFYTYASEPATGKADFSTMVQNNPAGVAANCQNVLLEWHASVRNGDLTVDSGAPRELLRVDKPQLNHNGGALQFGPDGLLYLTLGDGGAANDQGVGHQIEHGNAQTLAPGNLLGKIIRIDPLGHNSANGHYGIPRDNPFFDGEHSHGIPREIWAYGLRNPWRASFDSQTGALIVADVGQNDVEEIDIIEKGRNYGWPIKEGTFLFESTLPNRAGEGFVYANSPGSPAGLTDPIAEYDHADGETPPAHSTVDSRVAAVGGFVYHGDEVEALRGAYVFGDYSTEIGILPPAGHLWVLAAPHQPVKQIDVTGRPKGGDLGLAVLGFAQDARGELYLLANTSGTLFGVTGLVLKLTAVSEN